MTVQTRVSAKGQVVIPKNLRDRLAWIPGTALDVVETAEGLALRRSAPAKHSDFDTALACLRAAGQWKGPRFSEAEEKAAVDAMLRKNRSGR
jgi:AbrB family looped-hinge helix DNA binding protein